MALYPKERHTLRRLLISASYANVWLNWRPQAT